MKPETIKRLQENVPELQEFISFLRAEAAKLNTLDGINVENRNAVGDIALETMARKRAFETIARILSPLLSTVDNATGVDPKEYVV